MQRDFTAAVDQAARELGAIQGLKGYTYTIETKAGPLHFGALASGLGPGGQFVSRFEDVDRACALLNPSKSLNSFTGLNPYSGKWNLILYDAEPETVCARVVAHVRPVVAQ